MINKILFVHKADVDLKEYIHLNNFHYKYWPATYWEPDDEEIEYDLEVDQEFYDSIVLVPVELYNDEIKFFEYEGFKYHNTQEDEYIKFFNDNGYELFWSGLLEELADSEKQAKDSIEAYIDELVEEIIEDKING